MGLYVYGLASSIEGGIEIARDVLRSGKGLVKLDEWIEVTQTIQQQSSSS
jgi:anthranilate phosphoribosyltransferase